MNSEENIKKQIISQINSNFPEDKKQEAIEKINSMNSQELEEFLIQNNLIKSGGLEKQAVQKCIFCSILQGEIPTKKISENKNAIAVLEINPISKGHSLILPREHLENPAKIPNSVFSLAKKISKKIKTKLKPREVEIYSSVVFGHSILNILPVYEKEHAGSPRKQAKPEELDELKTILEEKPKKKIIKQKPQEKVIEKKEPKLWLNPRIP